MPERTGSTAPPRVAFVTFGCKVNQAESEEIASVLPGGQRVRDIAEADVIVINTCTVTGEADHKVRKAVRHALAQQRGPVVVVTGCLAAVDAAGLEALGERVVADADKTRVRERVRAFAAPARADGAGAMPPAGRARVQLKIEDGCDTFCTYCIVPFARGVPRAVSLDTITERARALATAGVAEVVLTGINIGRYDDRGARLADVIEAVAASGIPRIRLSSIEPPDLDDALLGALAATPSFCRHLHVPLQSGSDTVLARMRRPYDTRAYAARIAAARSALPGLALSTDIIAGFPQETPAEHEATLAFAEEMRFMRLHVFRYSARAGTPAAEMAGQVDAPTRARRASELRALGERGAHAEAMAREGSVAEVLVERVTAARGGGLRSVEGVTREYTRVLVSHPDAAPGDLLRVRLAGPQPSGEVTGVVESAV